ncbi:MAG: thioredoxin family protein [Candidatus Dojkabacteria bacterium]|nr:thioredoxin family protein [Candidatus Dojkabacteria bacterium]MDQ7021898.1 thioredoxin family protein [Candidatus Dojkabacteria bacterium]
MDKKTRRAKFITKLIILAVILIGVYIPLKNHIDIEIVDKDKYENIEINNYTKVDKAEEMGIVNVNSFHSSYEKSVVLFTSTWCGPCLHLTNILKEQAINYQNIQFFEIDIDANRELAEKLNVKITPTIVMIDATRAAYESNVGKEDIISDLNFFSIIGVSNLPTTYTRID